MIVNYVREYHSKLEFLETGETCDQLAAYSVKPVVEDGRIIDFVCQNTPDSCRWRICQCDRAFAHKIKDKVSQLWNSLWRAF